MVLYFDDLHRLGIKPRVHGNGFIQLDLSKVHRLHIWPENKLPAQKVYTGIHNHKFGFKSRILLGKLCHRQFQEYYPHHNGEYQLYKAVPRDKEDTELVLSDQHRYDFAGEQTFTLAAGSEYEFQHNFFHESNGIGLTATFLTKTNVQQDLVPLVACRHFEKPDNDFNRYQIDEKVLWDIISEVFSNIKCIKD